MKHGQKTLDFDAQLQLSTRFCKTALAHFISGSVVTQDRQLQCWCFLNLSVNNDLAFQGEGWLGRNHC